MQTTVVILITIEILVSISPHIVTVFFNGFAKDLESGSKKQKAGPCRERSWPRSGGESPKLHLSCLRS